MFDTDDLTDEEKAALASLENDNTAPEPEDEEKLPGIEPVAAEPAAEAAPATGDPAPELDEAFKAFLDQHKGKSPEEITRLAFQQQKRADKTAFDLRRTTGQSAELAERARAALEGRKASIAEQRKAFSERLETDPDAATKQLADERFDAAERFAEQEVERLEHEARLEAAIDLASRAIPDFQTQFPAIRDFGGEMGYSPEEVAGISDGRDVVVLYLAKITGDLIKSGVIDTRGQLLAAPPAVAATDPRLAVPAAPKTLTAAPGRTTDAAKSIEDQLADLLSLSDAEFAKIDDDTLRRLTGGR